VPVQDDGVDGVLQDALLDTPRSSSNRKEILGALEEVHERLERARAEGDGPATYEAKALARLYESMLDEVPHDKVTDAVRAAIRFAIGKVREDHPDLGEHLAASIRYASRSWYYEPPVGARVKIEVEWDYGNQR
jgi:hypothetical protein